MPDKGKNTGECPTEVEERWANSAPEIKIFTAKSPAALEVSVNTFLYHAERIERGFETPNGYQERFRIDKVAYSVDKGVYSAMLYYFRYPILW